MEELIRLVLVIVLLNIGLAAYVLSLRALFPRRAARTRAAANGMPGRSFAVGLVNGLFFGALAFILVSLGDKAGQILKVLLFLPALVCLALLSVGLSFGLLAMAELLGERLAPNADGLRRALWGVWTLSLGSSLPFVGWFLLLPYAGLTGLGAFIIGFIWRDPAAP